MEKILSPNLFTPEAKISDIILTIDDLQTLFGFFPKSPKHIKLLFKGS
jgi:hypothetical protein